MGRFVTPMELLEWIITHRWVQIFSLFNWKFNFVSKQRHVIALITLVPVYIVNSLRRDGRQQSFLVHPG